MIVEGEGAVLGVNTVMVSMGARACIGCLGQSPTGDPGDSPGEGLGAKPPEAEISVSFEALVEEPNLTLMTDSFLARCCLSA